MGAMPAGDAAVLDAPAARSGQVQQGGDALFEPPQAAASGKVVFSLGEVPELVPDSKQGKWSPVHVWHML